MILTILSHMDIVTILFVIGITLIVVPIFLYKIVMKNNEKLKAKIPLAVTLAIVCCIPMLYYFYLDIRYNVSEFTMNDKLYLAVENYNLSAAESLLNDGADPTGDNRYGRVAMYRAVMLGEDDMVELLLKGGGDPNYTGNETVTMLGEACKNQDCEAAEVLIRYGADPDLMSDKYVPALHYAAIYDDGFNTKLIGILVDGGADPASISYRGNKKMLPFRYYFDRYVDEVYSEGGISPEDEKKYLEIKEMLYRPYIDWLMDKMINENIERKNNSETVS